VKKEDMKSRRHSSGGIFPLIKSYEEGILTRGEFCERTGLKECSFNYWLKKYRMSVKGETTPGRKERTSSFIRIQTDQGTVDDYRMEIILKGGCRIRFTSLVPIEYVEAILSRQ